MNISWFSQKSTIIYLNKINWLVFVDKKCVFCALESEFVYLIKMKLNLNNNLNNNNNHHCLYTRLFN